MSVLFFLKSKQPADPKFEELKRQIIKHLKAQDDEDTAGIDIDEDSIEKGGMAVGTIREWKGQKHIKGADGKWRRYYNKETRGAKVSIKHLIKKVEVINNPEDLMKLVLLHRDRFSDDNGHPIPLAQELSKYVSEREGKLAPQAPAKKPQKMAASKQPEKDSAKMRVEKRLKEERKKLSAAKSRLKKVQADNAEKFAAGNLKKNEGMRLNMSEGSAWKNVQYHEKALADLLKEAKSLGIDTGEEQEESEAEKHQNRSDAMKGNKNAYKGGPKPQPEKEKKAEQEETAKARKKAKMPPVEKHDRVSNMKDSTWNPNSEDYRYKDTGYIAGARKELAQSFIRKKARDGEQITNEAIDWTGIEENELMAAELITKQNLMGKTGWEELKTGGLSGSAGFIINQLYKTINSKPEKDTPENRYNFSRGIDAIRSRLEACKTFDELSYEIAEIQGEISGRYLSSKRTPEFLKLAEKREKILKEEMECNERLKTEIFKKDDPFNEAREWFKMNMHPSLDINKLFDADGSWKGRCYAYNEKAQINILKKCKEKYEEMKSAAEKKLGVTTRELIEHRNKIEDQMREVTKEANEKAELTNTMRSAWSTFGRRFHEAVETFTDMTGSNRSSYDSGFSKVHSRIVSNVSFANHIESAWTLKDDDFSWAEKKHAGGGGGQRKTQFELLVADKIVRKGGRKIKEHPSNVELKQMFNLRDVQLGEWVAKDVKSATFHVENVAMGLADLADITGIPDNLVSLNGRLAVALGARGHSKALAHYEPLEQVINITKMKGGGSLGHEWFHAFDNLIANAMTGGKYNVFLTESGRYEDLTDMQRHLVSNMLREKRYMEDQSKPEPAREWSRVSYERYKEKAKKAGVKNIDEIESQEDHVVAVKNAFANLAKEMMTGSATRTEDIHYTKDDYEYVNSESGKKFMEDVVKETFEETIEKRKNTNYYQGYKRIKPAQLRRYIAAYFGKEEKGGFMTSNTEKLTSNFFENSKKLESNRSKPYWSDIKEMGARAFAAYLDDKLVEKGQKNTYLTDKASNDDYKNHKPYPEGEERKAINAAFDELFKVVKETGAIRKAIMAEFVITVQKSEGDKLNYFKKLVLDHLNTLEEDGKELKKSLMEAETAELKKSGRSLPVGTIRDWKGQKYIKTAPGKWKPKYDSHTRGAKMAIHAIKRKVAAAKTAADILKIVNENKERFSDSKGKPLPFVKELNDFVQYQTEHKPKPRKPKEKQGLSEIQSNWDRDNPNSPMKFGDDKPAAKKPKVDIKKLWEERTGDKFPKTVEEFDNLGRRAVMIFDLENGKYNARSNGGFYGQNKDENMRSFSSFDEALDWAKDQMNGKKTFILGKKGKEINPIFEPEKGIPPKPNYKDMGSLKEAYKDGKIDFETATYEYLALRPQQDKVGAEGDIRHNWKQPDKKPAKPDKKPSKPKNKKLKDYDRNDVKQELIDTYSMTDKEANALIEAIMKNSGKPVEAADYLEKQGINIPWEDIQDSRNLIYNVLIDQDWEEKPEGKKEENWKDHAAARLMNEDFDFLESFVNGEINRTEFHQKLSEKGYTVKDINDIERFSETVKPGSTPTGVYPNTGFLRFEDGMFHFSDPTRDRTDPNSKHRGGFRETADIKRRMSEMESKGMSFVDETSGDSYSVDDAIKQLQAGRRLAVGIKGKTLRREVNEEKAKVKKAVSEVLADIFN